MKVKRSKRDRFARRPSRRRGCAPLFVLIAVAMFVVALGRDWIGSWLHAQGTPGAASHLPAARAAFQAGDLSEAIRRAQAMLENDVFHEAAHDLLSRALIYRSYSDFAHQADRERALSISAEAASRFARSPGAQAVHAFVLQAIGSPAEAQRVALRVIERAPDHVLARVALSLSYGAQGIFEAALREAERAAELADRGDSHRLESYRALAIAYGDRGEYRRALEELDRAIEIYEKLIPLHFEAALYARQTGDIDRATVSYFRVMALDADNVKVRVRLCELSNHLRERKTALRYCQEAAELAPELAEAWRRLGREYFLGGNFAAAQAAFKECVRLQMEQESRAQELQLACWILQGQSAEIRGDCEALRSIHAEFLDLVRREDLPQTWSYPPGGPPNCAPIAGGEGQREPAG